MPVATAPFDLPSVVHMIPDGVSFERADMIAYLAPGSGKWLAINREYETLLDIMSTSEGLMTEALTCQERQLVRRFAQRGFVSEVPYSGTEKVQASDAGESFSVIVCLTNDCNLECAYCKRRDKQRTTMTPALVDALHDWAFSQPHNRILFSFGGGETFSRWDLFRYFVESAQRKAHIAGKACEFGVPTNGTFFSRKVMDFCKRHSIRLQLSIDGPPSLHDSQRRTKHGHGSAGKILPWLPELSELEMVNSVFATLMKAQDVGPVATFFLEYPCAPVWLNMRLADYCGISPEEARRFALRQTEVLRECLDRMMDGRRFLFLGQPLAILRNLLGFQTGGCEGRPCKGGRALAAVNADGTIFSCIEGTLLRNFQIGSLDRHEEPPQRILPPGVYQSAHPIRCATCNWRGLCQGPCPAKDQATLDMNCSCRRALFEELLWLLVFRRDDTMTYFRRARSSASHQAISRMATEESSTT